MFMGFKVFVNRKAGLVSQDSEGIAVKGYDMVALRNKEMLIKGNSEHSLVYNDATWLFSTKDNCDLFGKNLYEYLPEFGGYCAWSVANDSDLPPSSGDPAAYDIVDGKMYFKWNKIVRFLWRLSKLKYIKKGNVRWPQFVEAITEYIKITS